MKTSQEATVQQLIIQSAEDLKLGLLEANVKGDAICASFTEESCAAILWAFLRTMPFAYKNVEVKKGFLTDGVSPAWNTWAELQPVDDANHIYHSTHE